MDFLTPISQMLGSKGTIILCGVLIFILIYKNSVFLFEWIESQTLGTKDFILGKFELMFMDVDPKHVTTALLAISFGLGLTVLAIYAILGMWGTGVVMGTIFGFIGWKVPKPIINKMVKRRIKVYQSQMVDAMQLLSNGIRAGLSLPQCLAMVSDELPNPISQEYNLMLQQNRIGVPLEECFENLLKRIPLQDNEMFVTSVNILRESGGNLAETFDTIVTVIRERIKVQQKIDTYVAQGMIQGQVIFLMPYILAAVFGFSDPESMQRAVSHPLGIGMFVLAFLMTLIGGFVIMKLVQIDV